LYGNKSNKYAWLIIDDLEQNEIVFFLNFLLVTMIGFFLSSKAAIRIGLA
jgi:hypothetical protein